MTSKGSNVTFTCISEIKPTWSKGPDHNVFISRKITRSRKIRHYVVYEEGLAKHSLLLMNVQIEDSGKYNCEGRTNNTISFNNSAMLYVGGRNEVLIEGPFVCS